jgi:Protein of unknown function (DUF3108)
MRTETALMLPLLAVLAAPPVPPAAAPRAAPAPAADAGPATLPDAWRDESMEFTISYLGLQAGRARISVGQREGALLPVFLEARTSGIGAVIDFRQQLASYLDVASGLPRSSSMLSVEPTYRRTVTTRYDRDAGIATVRTRARRERVNEVPVPKDAVDFVALVFRLRTLRLEPGDSHAFAVLSGTRLAKVVAAVEGREKVETPAGTFPAVKVRVPTGFSGRFSEKNPTYVWFSDDARRAIVRLETDFAVGGAVAELTSYRGGAR